MGSSLAPRTCWTVIVLLALVSGSAAPVDAQARARTSVDTTRATVGDRIELTVAVEHAADAAVAWPDSIDLSPFEVLDARVSPVRAEGGRATSTAVFTLAAFELGTLEIPSFDVEVLTPDGGVETVATDGWGIEIVSVGSDETGDIREIRGPLSIPVGLVPIALGLLALLAVALGAYFLARRARSGDDAEMARSPGPPPRPAHEIALEALDRLEASPMLGQGRVKEYHIEVSDILRRYVETRFAVDALEMTTGEVLAGLERAGVDPDFRAGLRAFLEPCDMVKFAKVRPNADASREVLRAGRALVERSIAHIDAPDVSDRGDTVADRGVSAPRADTRPEVVR